MRSLYEYDFLIAKSIYRRTKHRLQYELLSHLGDGIFWFGMVLPGLLLCYWMDAGFFKDSNTVKFIKMLYFNLVLDLAVIVVLKMVFRRQRPPHHVADARFVGPDVHSFPSGHATRVGCLVAFFHHQGMYFASIWILAMLVCYSRIALGRHYPSDVLAGAFIGYYLVQPLGVEIYRCFTSK